jgi:hypothetical protein
MVRIKAKMAVRLELVEGQNGESITLMLRQAQGERLMELRISIVATVTKNPSYLEAR